MTKLRFYLLPMLIAVCAWLSGWFAHAWWTERTAIEIRPPTVWSIGGQGMECGASLNGTDVWWHVRADGACYMEDAYNKFNNPERYK